jgi:hypothetical protein
MNKREKFLSWVVVGVFFFIINFYAVKFLVANQRTLSVSRGQIEGEIKFYRLQESEREMWSQRDAWLDDSLKPLGDSDVANRKLIEDVQNIAKKHTVTLEAPQPGSPLRLPLYTTLATKLQARASWTQMYDFIQELQAPGQFLSLEGDLKVDATDKTQLRADLTVSRWFQSDTKAK